LPLDMSTCLYRSCSMTHSGWRGAQFYQLDGIAPSHICEHQTEKAACTPCVMSSLLRLTFGMSLRIFCRLAVSADLCNMMNSGIQSKLPQAVGYMRKG